MADRKRSQHFLILICCISLYHDRKDTSRAKKADEHSFGQCWNRTTCTGRWGGCRRRGWTRCPPPWLRLDLNIRIKCFQDALDKTSNHKIFSSPALTLPTYSPLFFFQKHSSVRGWWGTFESTKTRIPACIWLHPATNHILKSELSVWECVCAA